MPLPPPAEPAPLEPPIHDVAGDELAPIIPKLDALAHELGCPVAEEPMSDGCHGYYEIETGRIAIDTSLSAKRQGQDAMPRASARADPPRAPRR